MDGDGTTFLRVTLFYSMLYTIAKRLQYSNIQQTLTHTHVE